MTTLAIIGSGVAGRSLLYHLTDQNFSVGSILLFDAEPFAPACSRSSTAIVAPRGVTAGHSALGDKLIAGLAAFTDFVTTKGPAGVTAIPQFTGTLNKQEEFRKRYPDSTLTKALPLFSLKREMLMTQEDAYLIDPELYLGWLAEQSRPVDHISSLVTGVEVGEKKVTLTTQDQRRFEADHVIFATGAASRFWARQFPEPLATSRPVQGCYLEFDLGLKLPSFSLTLESKNMVYRAHSQKLLVGSTSAEVAHDLVPLKELRGIHEYLRDAVELPIPKFEAGVIRTGHREKARKREPYLRTEGRVSFIGGLYKNGFNLSIGMTKTLTRQLPALS